VFREHNNRVRKRNNKIPSVPELIKEFQAEKKQCGHVGISENHTCRISMARKDHRIADKNPI
jgi:hypothetical protein